MMDFDSSASRSTKPTTLGSEEVDVWCADLRLSSSELCQIERTLSPDEHDRAVQFHFPKDRRRFIAARGILRDILSRYLRCPPTAPLFCYAHFGKPHLAPQFSSGGLQFNLSHSDDLALYAVTYRGEVGVDLERIDSKHVEDGVAERFFSHNERTKIISLPERARIAAFFDFWTRKEAYVKARGGGLQIPLESFDVSMDLVRSACSCEDQRAWTLRSLAVSPAYAAAIAAEGSDWRLRFWEWHMPPAE